MIEPSTLPYVDLAASADHLRKYAQDYFGKKISPLAGDDTVRDRFKAIYLEEAGITLADIGPDVDNDFDDEDKEVDQKAADNRPKPIAATIIVQDDPLDPGAISGGTNFVPYRIMRNVEVRVSIPILNSLREAVKTIYDPVTMAPKNVLAYPFSVVEMHYE